MENLIQIYKNSRIPVLITDTYLTIVWANDAAKDNYPHFQHADGLRLMIPEFSVDDILQKLNSDGTFDAIDVVTPLSSLDISILPVRNNQTNEIEYTLTHIRLADEVGKIVAGAYDTISAITNSIRNPLFDLFTALPEPTQRNDDMSDVPKALLIDSKTISAYRILKSCNNLSEMLQYMHGVHTFKIVRVNIRHLLTNISEACAAIVENIKINWIFPDEDVFVACDGDMVQNIMLRLISNSVIFIGNGTNITVYARASQNRVAITVADNGLGIPFEIQDKIFLPYFSHSHPGMKFIGEGLGLTIAKYAVACCNGTMAMNSVPGKGTNVSFSLPVAPDPDKKTIIKSIKRFGTYDMNVRYKLANDVSDYLGDRYSKYYVLLSDVIDKHSRKENKDKV